MKETAVLPCQLYVHTKHRTNAKLVSEEVRASFQYTRPMRERERERGGPIECFHQSNYTYPKRKYTLITKLSPICSILTFTPERCVHEQTAVPRKAEMYILGSENPPFPGEILTTMYPSVQWHNTELN